MLNPNITSLEDVRERHAEREEKAAWDRIIETAELAEEESARIERERLVRRNLEAERLERKRVKARKDRFKARVEKMTSRPRVVATDGKSRGKQNKTSRRRRRDGNGAAILCRR